MKSAKPSIDDQYAKTTQMLKAWSKKYFCQRRLDSDVINELRAISRIINKWREENDAKYVLPETEEQFFKKIAKEAITTKLSRVHPQDRSIFHVRDDLEKFLKLICEDNYLFLDRL
jgi:hypothetical protein